MSSVNGVGSYYRAVTYCMRCSDIYVQYTYDVTRACISQDVSCAGRNNLRPWPQANSDAQELRKCFPHWLVFLPVTVLPTV